MHHDLPIRSLVRHLGDQDALALGCFLVDLRVLIPDHLHQLALDTLGAIQQVLGVVIPNDQDGCILKESGKVMLLALW